MKCPDCKNFNKEIEICNLPPSELDDIACLLRHIAWILNLEIMDEMDEREEGEQWKNK